MRKRIIKYADIVKSDLAKYTCETGTDEITANCPVEKPVKELLIKGNCRQNSYSGTNLFDKTSILSTANVSVTQTATGFIVEALNQSSYSSASFGEFSVVGGGTYTFSADIILTPVADESMRGYIIIFEYDSENQKIKTDYLKSLTGSIELNQSLTVQNTAAKIQVLFYVAYGQPGCAGQKVEYKNLTLYSGQIATEYEPYVGAMPSPSVSYPQAVLSASGLTLTFGEGADAVSVVAPSSLTVNGQTVALNFAKIGDVCDELSVKNGVVRYVTRIGKIASYSGETVSTAYISSTGSLSTGATVYYVLSEQVSFDITATTLGSAILSLNLHGGNCKVKAAGDVPVSYLKIKYSEKI